MRDSEKKLHEAYESLNKSFDKFDEAGNKVERQLTLLNGGLWGALIAYIIIEML